MPEVRCSCGYKLTAAARPEPMQLPCPMCGRGIHVPASAEPATETQNSGQPTSSTSESKGTKPSGQAKPNSGGNAAAEFDPFQALQPAIMNSGGLSDARAEKQFRQTLLISGALVGGVVALIGLIWGVSSMVGGFGSSNSSSNSSGPSSSSSSSSSGPKIKYSDSIGFGGGEGESGTSKSGIARGASNTGHGRGAADDGRETGSAKGPPTRTENQSKLSGTDQGTNAADMISQQENQNQNISVDEQKLAALRKDNNTGSTGQLGAMLPEDGLNVPSLAPDLSTIMKRKGSGGFGARGMAGRAQRVQNGATPDVERAIELALRWMASIQGANGSWNPAEHGGHEENRLGVTSLCLLAFLGDGHHPASKTSYSAAVNKGIDYVLSQQDLTTGRMTSKTFYEQGIALMVMCEAYGLTKDEKYKEPSQKLLDYIISQAGSNGGYTYGGPGTDTSVTGFQIMALKSAMMAGLTVPDDAILKAHTYLRDCTHDDGQAGYNGRNDVRISMTAVAMCCRLFMGYGIDDPLVAKAGQLIATSGPNISDEYFTYYATYCMFQVGGAQWRNWNRVFRPAVIGLQDTKTKGLVGSFPAGATTGGAHAGRIYSTAMYVLTLQVYARFLPMYR